MLAPMMSHENLSLVFWVYIWGKGCFVFAASSLRRKHKSLVLGRSQLPLDADEPNDFSDLE